MSMDEIEYELPYARALQLLSIDNMKQGRTFLSDLEPGESFAEIAGSLLD